MGVDAVEVRAQVVFFGSKSTDATVDNLVLPLQLLLHRHFNFSIIDSRPTYGPKTSISRFTTSQYLTVESPGKLSLGVEEALGVYMAEFQGWDVHMGEDGHF